jgi:two-component system, OmpR family, sensor histidine kinase SenX3
MRVSGRRKSIAFFIVQGACLVALAVALNIGWIVLNVREVALLVLGIVFFNAIIAGLVLNTTFLVREIRRNEQHDAFINAVTHELKTPIASIRLYLETLQTRDVSPEKRQEFYDVMLADSDRLLHTVEQVLRAGQVGHKRPRGAKNVFDIGKLAEQSIELARLRYKSEDGAFAFVESLNGGARPLIEGDAEEMSTVLSNLLDNAVKYSDGELKVKVTVESVGEKAVQIIVRDNGIGIPSHQLKRIFKRFHRAPGRLLGRVKGTGLGLFIVRSVVKRHGGKVFATSEGEGHGSTFTISLPRAQTK